MSNNQQIHIAKLLLANDKHTLTVTVEYRKRSGYYLRIICVDGGMYQLFGGPTGANILLEAAERFNAKKLEQWAKAFSSGPSHNVTYAEAVNAVCEANGYVLATGEEDAYKPEEFVRGQRVTIGNEPALIVNVAGIGKFSGKQEYDLVLDSNWFWLNRNADAYGQQIKAIEGAEILDGHAVDMRFREYQEAVAEREAEKSREINAKAAAEADQLAELKRLYPWAKQDGSKHARASANLKTELSMKWPGTTFSVKSDSYSMGDSVSVKWTDGPTGKQVDEIANKYQYTYLTEGDMLSDGQSYKSDVFSKAAQVWLGSSKYVRTNRSISESATLAVTAAVEAAFGAETAQDWGHYNSTARILDRSEIYGEFDRLEKAADEVGQVAIFKRTDRSFAAQVVDAIEGSGSKSGATMCENFDKNGVEIRFADKPDETVRTDLKRNGFRWSKFQKIWYAKRSDRTLGFAQGLVRA